MKINPLHAIDFYKADHHNQYEKGTNKIFSNFTPRSSRLFKGSKLFDEKIVNYGYQLYVMEFLIETWNEGFFERPKSQVVRKFKRRMDTSLGKDVIGTEHIEALHDIGYLPISIRALEEGTRSSFKIPVLTITETIPEFFWLVGYLESSLSTDIWKCITSATTAYEYRRVFEHFAELTGADRNFIPWQGHDFSMRGLSGKEDGARSGGGHILSFTGSDTVLAIDMMEDYYDADADVEMIAGSICGTEHSIMMLGLKDNEKETIRRLIQDVHPTGMIAVVSDTWDYWNVVTKTLVELKEIITNRGVQENIFSKVVIRPDSGNPVDIICGTVGVTEVSSKEEAGEILEDRIRYSTPHGECGEDEPSEIFVFNGKYYFCKLQIDWNRYDKQYYYIDYSRVTKWEEIELNPEQKGTVECLWNIFGGTINEAGFKVLNPCIGMIYGDSITLEKQWDILEKLRLKGFSSENVVLGVGSYTYNFTTRDTLGMAMKATYGEVLGESRELSKDPKTDSGVKKSALGLLSVIEDENGELILKEQSTWDEVLSSDNKLKLLFEDGKLVRKTTLKEMRERLLK